MVDMLKKRLFFFSEAVDNDTLDEIMSKQKRVIQELEMMAVLAAVKSCHSFLKSRKVVLFTDSASRAKLFQIVMMCCRKASYAISSCKSAQRHGKVPPGTKARVSIMLSGRQLVKTTHERCGPFSLVVLSQRRGRVTTSSGPTLSETLSSKTLQVS